MSSQFARCFGTVLAFALAGLAVTIGLAGSAAAGSPSAAALACTCAQPNPTNDLSAYAAEADVVFSGTLNAVRVAPRLPDQPKNAPRQVRYVVAVENVYQGTLPGTTARVAPKDVRQSCQLDQLPVGQRYLFFVDLVEGAPVVGGKCSGTQELTTAVLNELEVAFPAPPEPEPEVITATRTQVAEEDRIEFARLAAPGAALVIVGALGLAIVNRLGRDHQAD